MVGENAFSGSSKLKSVTIMSNMKTLKASTFEGCDALENVILSEELKSIGEKAFKGCNKLKSIELPSNLTSIEYCAFCDSGLTSVTIPVNVSTIGAQPFEGCNDLSRIEVDEDNVKFKSIDGVLLDIGGEEIIQFPKGWVGEYIMPENVTSIDKTTFSNCRLLSSVTIGRNVEEMESKVFSGCSSLTQIHVDSQNTFFKSIDGVLYDNQYSINEYPEGRKGAYIIPDNIWTIRSEAFKGCSGLTSITIPWFTMNIESEAFDGCNNLEVVSYLGSYDPFIGFSGSAFEGCDSLHQICVPIGYRSSEFCARSDYCMTDSCSDIHLSGDHCYEDTCLNGKLVVQKRQNATEYEEQLHACVDFICDNNIGATARSMCSSTKQQRYMCMNDGCLAFGTETRVEIDVGSDLFAGDVDMQQLDSEVSSLTDDENVMKVGLELSDNAYVVQIIVLVEDEYIAEKIVEAVQKIDHDNCEQDILCRSKDAKLIATPLIISDGKMNHPGIMLTTLIVLLMITVIRNNF